MYAKRSLLACLAALIVAAGCESARADWPLVWDLDSRDDTPIAATLGVGDDLWLLSASLVQLSSSKRAVMLRIDARGAVLSATPDPAMSSPIAMALRPDGNALAMEHWHGDLRVTAFGPDGAILWSRTRSGLISPFDTRIGPQLIWDDENGVWCIATGISGAFAALSYTSSGEPLADRLWPPATGSGSATSLMPREGGGILLSGVGFKDGSSNFPVRWWTVALDANGNEIWHHVQETGTHGSAFGGSHLLSADPVRVWADGENDRGVDSLLLWSINATTGDPLWVSRWPVQVNPVNGDRLKPQSVAITDDRILVSGLGQLGSSTIDSDVLMLSFDATDGSLVWLRSPVDQTHSIATAVSTFAGATMLAISQFPQPNPGTSRLWTAAWNRDGVECAPPIEVLPSRIIESLATASGDRILVGSESGDIVVQSVADPCRVIFRDGFDG
jgi:hypothetical protein